MVLSWGDIFFMVGLSVAVGVVIGWVVCWAIAMRWGEKTAWLRFRRHMRDNPTVAMTVFPAGVSLAQLVPQQATRDEAEELVETWRDYVIVNGSSDVVRSETCAG